MESPSGPLTRLVSWTHRVLAEVLTPGAFAVDLTAGNGHDTLFLYRCVGPNGRVLALDRQARAVRHTAERLRGAGAPVTVREAGAPDTSPLPSGVTLVCGNHAHWGDITTPPALAVVANLGYLPGENSSPPTDAASTLPALEQGLRRLRVGGRLAVVCYVGHPGGREEAHAVDERMAVLSPTCWRVLRITVGNQPAAPFLLVAEKRGGAAFAVPHERGTLGLTPSHHTEENHMSEIYTCESCGATTTEKGHLCNPSPVEDACDLCSEPVQDARHICKPMRAELEYVCGGCGRPATSPDLVCKPQKMGG